MDFSMRINIKKVGERYIVTDDANIRLLDTGLKGKEVWQHYFDVRHKQACEQRNSHELSNCIKPDVMQQSELFTCKFEGGKDKCRYKAKDYFTCVMLRRCEFASE